LIEFHFKSTEALKVFRDKIREVKIDGAEEETKNDKRDKEE